MEKSKGDIRDLCRNKKKGGSGIKKGDLDCKGVGGGGALVPTPKPPPIKSALKD